MPTNTFGFIRIVHVCIEGLEGLCLGIYSSSRVFGTYFSHCLGGVISLRLRLFIAHPFSLMTSKVENMGYRLKRKTQSRI